VHINIIRTETVPPKNFHQT